MKEAFDLMVYFCMVLGIAIIVAIYSFIMHEKGKMSLVQDLCTKQQYDFCEVAKQKIEYKLRVQE